MFELDIDSKKVRLINWVLLPLSLDKLRITRLVFDDNDDCMQLYAGSDLVANSVFCCPSLITQYGLHLSLRCNRGQMAKGWIVRSAVDSTNYTRLSRWISRQRKHNYTL